MVRVEGLVLMVRVRGPRRAMHYVYESPYKDRNKRACVCVCHSAPNVQSIAHIAQY